MKRNPWLFSVLGNYMRIIICGNYRELYGEYRKIWGTIGNYTNYIYGDYTEPLKGSLSNNQASMESQAGFFPWLNGAVDVTLFGKKRQPF